METELGLWGFTSAWALVCLFVILIARGDLLPRRSVERELEACAAQLASRLRELEIRDAQIAVKDAQIAEKDVQLRMNADLARSVETTLRTLRVVAGGAPEDRPRSGEDST